MRVVAIDTAGPVVGVGAADGDRVAVATSRVTRGAEAWLLPTLNGLLDELGLAWGDVQGVGVAAGPGAFTGLRVGLATASGLAFARGVPLWPAGSLDHRAASAGSGWRLAMLDARKGKVYAQLVDPSGAIVHGPADVLPDVAIGWASPPFHAVGEGALAYRDAVEAAGGAVVEGADAPGMAALLAATVEALAAGRGRPAIEVAPRYLRAPDAKVPGDRTVRPRGSEDTWDAT